MGRWHISRIEISPDAAMLANLRYRERSVSPGHYTRLMYDGRVVMSDTDAELRDFLQYRHLLHGHVLMNGLGLGVHLGICLMQEMVRKVTVIELAETLIGMVGEHYQVIAGENGVSLSIIHGDAFTWRAPVGARFGFVWHDIWPDLSSDNLPQMTILHRRYGSRCDAQASWGHSECLRARASEKVENQQYERWAKVRAAVTYAE